MKEFTMAGIQKLYCDIQSKLSREEKDRFRYLIDCISWSDFKWCKDKELIHNGAKYEISLVDGTYFEVRFTYSQALRRFQTYDEVDHPQIYLGLKKDEFGRDKDIYCISEKIVKYIR